MTAHDAHEEVQAVATVTRRVQAVQSGELLASADDCVACEEPIAIEINGLSHVVMMATPADLEDFALGFLYTEGIVRQRADVQEIEIEHTSEGALARVRISNACFEQLKVVRRALLGRTGCGICGVESLQYFQNIQSQFVVRSKPAARHLDVRLLDEILQKFDATQTMRHQTGSTHAAAWMGWQGEVLHVREDVGRHNALDKLIGVLLKNQAQPNDGFVLVSSRASYEMVQKTAQWGASCLVSVSAATDKAIEWARAHEMQLIGFARQGRAVQYTPKVSQENCNE